MIFERAWEIAKMPYYIRPDPVTYKPRIDDLAVSRQRRQTLSEMVDEMSSGPHEVLYQGGKEGDPDSFFWTPDKQIAMLYAILGSDMYSSKPREGTPQLRMARPTEEDVMLNPDLGHQGAGVAGDLDFDDLKTLTNEFELDSEIIPFPGLDSEDLREMWGRLEDPWTGKDDHGNLGISLRMFGGGLDRDKQADVLDDWVV